MRAIYLGIEFIMSQKSELFNRIEEAVAYIRKAIAVQPEIGIVLGTGLGGLATEITTDVEINYSDIPHFAESTVETHHGKLIFGTLSGRPVVAMQGRFHFYEGYSMEQITFPVRAMKFLGVGTLLISNVCGSMNPNFNNGEIMLIEDHINLLPGNPLIGVNDEQLGPRFVDMAEPWSKRLISMAEEIGLQNRIKLHKGVYVALPGPSLETRAEYRFLRAIGADVVGMSTVPENIAARQMGMEVLGLSIITDECYPDALKPVDIAEIISIAHSAEPKLTYLFKELAGRI